MSVGAASTDWHGSSGGLALFGTEALEHRLTRL